MDEGKSGNECINKKDNEKKRSVGEGGECIYENDTEEV